MNTSQPKPKRRWRQFGLLPLFLVTAVLCVFVALIHYAGVVGVLIVVAVLPMLFLLTINSLGGNCFTGIDHGNAKLCCERTIVVINEDRGSYQYVTVWQAAGG